MAERSARSQRLGRSGRVITWLAAILAGLVSVPAWLYGCFASSVAETGLTPYGVGLGCHTQARLDGAARGAIVSLGFASLVVVWIILSAWSRRPALGLATALAATGAVVLALLALAPVAGGEGLDPWLLGLATIAALMGLASGLRWLALT